MIFHTAVSENFNDLGYGSSVQPQLQIIHLGEEINLYCNIPDSYSWYKGDEAVNADHERIFIDNQRLYIQRATTLDGGRYGCEGPKTDSARVIVGSKLATWD